MKDVEIDYKVLFFGIITIGFLSVCTYFFDPGLVQSRNETEKHKIQCMGELLNSGWEYDVALDECTESHP